MPHVGIGITLQPELEFLERTEPLFDLVDYFEIAPETTWACLDGDLLPNGYHRYFLELGRRHARPFVAHGVGYSMGTGDTERQARWRGAMARDHQRFDYLWWSDHLGATSLAGQGVTLPIPLPLTDEVAASLRARLREMQGVVPTVGVENSVFYFTFGDPLDEPAFLSRVLQESGAHLVLDLHNVFTSALNLGFDPEDYLARLDVSRVVEIHLSGGTDSDSRWLPSGRKMRLDSHDDAIPEQVFDLCERWAPRCERLRGITLERMEGTVTAASDVQRLGEELDRMRFIAGRCGS